MDFEQIIRRLGKLDEEHEKNKSAISGLDERLSSIESTFKVISSQLKEISRDTSRFSTTATQLEQMDDVLSKQRTEINRLISEVKKQRDEFQKEVEKHYSLELDNIRKTLKSLNPKEIIQYQKARSEEESQLKGSVLKLETKMEETLRAKDEILKSHQSIEANLVQDNKRIADLTGEIKALRKRTDESREKEETNIKNIRRIEGRLSELVGSETERRQAHNALMEKQAVLWVERDKAWKEWEERFDWLGGKTGTLESQLQEWYTAQRALKRAQERYDEITQKFERRINEISEMQRLAEDRLRQEWVNFKADDQKRWSSYTLSQDEQHRESHTETDKLKNRVVSLEDLTQTHQDILQQLKDANEEYFQAMLAQIHELLSSFERIMGPTK